MKQKKNSLKTSFIALFVFLYVFTLIFNLDFLTVQADNTITYTNVLEDLQKDETFKVENYAVDETDYSLKVIQVAESVNNELFVYVYQPGGTALNITATHLNMSLDDDASITSIYTLKFLNSSGTLFKYLVNDVVLKDAVLRYYNVTSIYRPYVSGVDDDLPFDNTINAVSYKVGKIWEAYTSNSSGVVYSCYETETIQITEKYVGYIFSGTEDERRGAIDGYKNYFVSFSTDYNIDKLLSATVYYSSQYKYKSGVVKGQTGSEVTWETKDGQLENVEKSVYADEVVDITTGRWFWKEIYTFPRIEKTSNFITDETRQKTYQLGLLEANTYSLLTDEAYGAIKETQYSLRFFESEYHEIDFPRANFGAAYYLYDCTDVSNVSIINLEFETDGEIYSLGVVDNMQTGSDKPSNVVGVDVHFTWWKILLIVLALLCLPLIIAFFPQIIVFLWNCIKFLGNVVWEILKVFWYVITLPIEIFRD